MLIRCARLCKGHTEATHFKARLQLHGSVDAQLMLCFPCCNWFAGAALHGDFIRAKTAQESSMEFDTHDKLRRSARRLTNNTILGIAFTIWPLAKASPKCRGSLDPGVTACPLLPDMLINTRGRLLGWPHRCRLLSEHLLACFRCIAHSEELHDITYILHGTCQTSNPLQSLSCCCSHRCRRGRRCGRGRRFWPELL